MDNNEYYNKLPQTAYVVETPSGEYRYREYRYALSRYNNPDDSWAVLKQEIVDMEFGYIKFLKERKKKC